MRVEVSHDESVIIMGTQVCGKVLVVPWWATGGWWYADVDDVDGSIINGDRDALVFNVSVAIELVIGGQGGERYRVMNQRYETASDTITAVV